MKTCYMTDSGRVRSHNEDSVTILKNASDEYLLVVADGMGGHRKGEVASSIVVSRLGKRFNETPSNGTKLDADSLTKAVKEIIQSETSSNSLSTAVTQCECDYSNSVATTAFVWDVITALGLDKITHNHSNYTGSSSSGGSSSDSSGT